MTDWLVPKKSDKAAVNDDPVSPLAWNVRVRLVWVAGASGFLWLAVAWAIFW